MIIKILLCSFISFALCTLLYLIFRKNFALNTYSGVQKIHDGHVPRIGGFFLFIYLISISLLFNYENFFIFLISLLPMFLITLKEDLFFNVRAKTRLFFTLVSILIYFYLSRLELPFINFYFFNFINDIYILKILFFTFSLLVLINGCNMIDGANGLLNFSITSAIFCLWFLDTDNIYHNELIFILFFNLIFTFFNFPLGKVFLGDSGAYLLGFLVGIYTINIINTYALNPYIAILILIYPCFEVLFSFIRKFFYEKISPLNPDPYHLHLKINTYLFHISKNKFLSNNLTTLILSPLYLLPLVIIVFDPDFSIHVLFYILLFLFFYCLFYSCFKRVYVVKNC